MTRCGTMRVGMLSSLPVMRNRRRMSKMMQSRPVKLMKLMKMKRNNMVKRHKKDRMSRAMNEKKKRDKEKMLTKENEKKSLKRMRCIFLLMNELGKHWKKKSMPRMLVLCYLLEKFAR